MSANPSTGAHADVSEEIDKLWTAVDSVKTTQESLVERLIHIEEQGKARAQTTTTGLDRIERKMDERFEKLIIQLAEQTGAQKQQNTLAEQRLMRLKQLALIIGIVGTILSAVFSYQEIASYIWTHILHLKEPWP